MIAKTGTRFISFALLLMLCLSNIATLASSEGEIKVEEQVSSIQQEEPDKINILVNGNRVQSDVSPIIVNDITLVPVRVILEQLGMQVIWDGGTSTITCIKGNFVITLKIGDHVATVNGQMIPLSVPPIIQDGRTFIPIRFLTENLGGIASWEESSKTVHLYINIHHDDSDVLESVNIIDVEKIGTPIDYNFTDIHSLKSKVQLPPLKSDLSNIENMTEEDDIDLLSKYKFYITENNRYTDFIDLYDSVRLERQGDKLIMRPKFISSDVMANLYHALYGHYFMLVEYERVIPLHKVMVSKMLDSCIDMYNSIQEPKVKQAALKNVAYFGVANVLAGNNIPKTIPDKAKIMIEKELIKIDSQEGKEESAIFPYPIDYSQFKPRGRYAESEEFQQYFKSMMWLSSVPFPFEIKDERADEQILQASLITYSLFTSEAIEEWQKIYKITSFFVGESDDLTPLEYFELLKKVYGDKPNLSELAIEERLESMLKNSQEVRQPAINDTLEGNIGSLKQVDNRAIYTAPQFRFMGQRYILDSEIFHQLTYVDFDPGDDRPFPKGLDFPAALGNEKAFEILTEEYKEQDKWSEYIPSMKKMQEKVKDIDENTWKGKNLYLAWIWTLSSLINNSNAYYPNTLQGEHWQAKSLNTFLGSWAELRHDTLLYSKPSGPLTGSMKIEERFLAYVEPCISFYERLDYCAKWMEENLISLNIDEKELKPLQCFRSEVQFLKDISLRQINGQKIKTEEYEKLMYYGDSLRKIMVEIQMPAIINAVEKEEKGLPLTMMEWQIVNSDTFDAKEVVELYKANEIEEVYRILCNSDEYGNMAIIADVHSFKDQCLEIGVGMPHEINIIVPIEGKWYIAWGGIYSYYEFLQPISNRLDDGEWKHMVRMGEQPQVEPWLQQYFSD